MRNIVLVLLCVFLSSCSLVTVTQSHYKRQLPDLPQKGQISIDDVGAVAVGGTEINKGLMELNTIVELVDDIEPTKFIERIKKFQPRLDILVDFSYNIMGFLGVAWDKIDWDNPEEFFKQAEEKQKEMEEALKNERNRALELEKDVQDFTVKLAEKEKAVKSKEDELAANDGKWSARFSWWVRLLGGLLVFLFIVGVVWYAYQVFTRWAAGLPFKVAAFGGKSAAKGLTQIVKGLQSARVKIHNEKENGATAEERAALEKAMDILHRELAESGNEEVHKLVSAIKDKHRVEKITP